MNYVYKLKFERLGVDDNGNLFPIEDKPTLQARIMMSQLEIQQLHSEIADNLDVDIFEKLTQEIKHNIHLHID